MSRARDLGSLINSTAAGKNLIINGGFDFWQRGTTLSAAGSQFVADRWNTFRGGYAAGLTVSRQLVGDTTNLPGIQYCIRMQRDSGNTNTNGLGLSHNIESVNSLPLAGKTVTLSFWARAGATFLSSGGKISPLTLSGTGTDQATRNGLTNMVYVTSPQISPTANWVRYSVTGNIPSNATQVCLSIDGIVFGTAGVTDYYEITGVQLEIGSSSTQFSLSGGDTQGELAKCQRYFQRVENNVSTYLSLTLNHLPGFGNSYSQAVLFPVPMRSSVSLSFFDVANNSGKVTAYLSGGAVHNLTPTISQSSGSGFRMHLAGEYRYIDFYGTTASAEL